REERKPKESKIIDISNSLANSNIFDVNSIQPNSNINVPAFSMSLNLQSNNQQNNLIGNNLQNNNSLNNNRKPDSFKVDLSKVPRNFPYNIYEHDCEHGVANLVPIYQCCNSAYQCRKCHQEKDRSHKVGDTEFV